MMTTSESKIFIKSNRNDCPETETKVKLCKSYFYVISFQSLSQFWVYFLILTIWMDFSWYGFVMHAMVHFVKKINQNPYGTRERRLKRNWDLLSEYILVRCFVITAVSVLWPAVWQWRPGRASYHFLNIEQQPGPAATQSHGNTWTPT